MPAGSPPQVENEGPLPGLLVVILAAAALVGVGLYGLAAPLAPGEQGRSIARYGMAHRAAERRPTLPKSPAGGVTSGWRAPPATAAPGAALEPPAMDRLVGSWFRKQGESPRAARLLALVCSVLVLLALARLAGHAWGPWGAAGAVLVLAALPYGAAFATHLDRGVPGLFGMLMSLGSYVRYRDRRSVPAGAGTLLWLLFAGAFDWGAFLMAGAVAAHAIMGGLLLRIGGEPVQQRVSFHEFIGDRRAGNRVIWFGLLLAVIAGGELAYVASAGGSGVAAGLSRALSVAGDPDPAAAAPLAGAVLRHALALFGAPALVVLGAWPVAFAARVLRGRARAADAAPLALWFALLATVLLLRHRVAAEAALLKWGAPLAALCTVDLAVMLGAALRRRLGRRWPRGARPVARLASAALVVAVVAALVPGAVRAAHASRGVRGEIAGPAGAARPFDELLVFARLVNQETAPGDLLLVLRGLELPLEFHYYADRDHEALTGLAGLADRRAREPRLVLLFQDPLPPAERAAFLRLLRDHPALQIGPLWLLDLRRFSPGIRRHRFAPRTRAVDARTRYVAYPRLSTLGVEPVSDPWGDLELYTANGILPSPDAGPLPAEPPPPEQRDRLLAYHNFEVVRGGSALAGLREQLLAGYNVSRTRYLSPSHWVVGVRWSFKERQLSLMWECMRPPPPGPEPTLRLVGTPLDGQTRPVIEEYRPTVLLGQRRPGHLYEELHTLALKPKGRWRVSLASVERGPEGAGVVVRDATTLTEFAWGR